MNAQPNRGPMPLRFMFATALVALTCFVVTVVAWGHDDKALAVTFGIAGVALLIGNYYIRSRMWRNGTLPVRRP